LRDLGGRRHSKNRPLIARALLIVHGTRHRESVKISRDVEYKALSAHEQLRLDAEKRKRVQKDGMSDLFGGPSVAPEANLDGLVAHHMDIAEEEVPASLSDRGSAKASGTAA
jgi:hypothetical protein